VSAVDGCIAVLMVGLVLYALFGGADFGAGFWDLTAGGAKRGERPRALIDRSIGPVWEANHVWLIFCIVVLWTAFPPAYSAIFSTLIIPLTLAALGIVLRGSGFAFRKVSTRLGMRRVYGVVFALASVLTPFFLGAVLGAVASGRVPPGNAAGDLWTSWLNPTGIAVGALAVAVCAYLAAVYLIVDARHLGDAQLERHFTRRAFVAGIAAGVLAAAGLLVLRSDATRTFDRLTGTALPLVLVSAACGVAVLVLLALGRTRGTRVLAAAAVAAVVVAWGVAQWPYMLPETLTVDAAAGDPTTLAWVLVVFVVAIVLVIPSLFLLYVLDQRSRLEEE
jgi:cytochrome bd ubiquinol oxidase subunit II